MKSATLHLVGFATLSVVAAVRAQSAVICNGTQCKHKTAPRPLDTAQGLL